MTRQSSVGFTLCAVCLILLVGLACGACAGSEKEEALVFDAGPPPRPLFFEFEGLTWGMTPDEARRAWGPPAEDRIDLMRLAYRDRAGFNEVTLYFVPLGRDSNDKAMGLSIVSLYPGSDEKNVKPKSAVRPDLVSRFGEPITDPKIYESQTADMKYSEIFRAAECTLVIAEWARAEPQVNWPERLDRLRYVLAPALLLREVPKAEWSALRGTLALSPPPETKARYAEYEKDTDSGDTKKLLALFGPPNLYLEKAPGEGTLYYFWLTGSYFRFTIAGGRVQSRERAYYYEPE